MLACALSMTCLSYFLLLDFILTSEVVALVNLALYKPATQSGIYDDGLASRAVDGNRKTSYFQDSCTQSEFSQSAWWQVDLQGVYLIKSMIIINRGDCCPERLRNFTVEVSLQDPNTLEGFPRNTNSPVCFTQISPVSRGEVFSFQCQKLIAGRYVRVLKETATSTPLTMCEVEVYGFSLSRFEKQSFEGQPLRDVGLFNLDCARLCTHHKEFECRYLQIYLPTRTCKLLPDAGEISNKTADLDWITYMYY